jgi:hypothetical protein
MNLKARERELPDKTTTKHAKLSKEERLYCPVNPKLGYCRKNLLRPNAIIADYLPCKKTIELYTYLICDSVRNNNFYKAGNWSKANVPWDEIVLSCSRFK